MALEINFQSVKLEAESLPHLSTENQQIKSWICAPSSTFLPLNHLRPTVVCLGEFFSGNNCWCVYNGKMWASLRELYLMEEQKNREQFHTPSFFDLIGSSQITNYYCYVSARPGTKESLRCARFYTRSICCDQRKALFELAVSESAEMAFKEDLLCGSGSCVYSSTWAQSTQEQVPQEGWWTEGPVWGQGLGAGSWPSQLSLAPDSGPELVLV